MSIQANMIVVWVAEFPVLQNIKLDPNAVLEVICMTIAQVTALSGAVANVSTRRDNEYHAICRQSDTSTNRDRKVGGQDVGR